MIIIPIKFCFWQHGTLFQNREKGFLILNSLHGWLGLGKQQHFFCFYYLCITAMVIWEKKFLEEHLEGVLWD